MSENRLEAVLWDMDGVIADTGAYHFQAWQEVFSGRGFNYSGEDFRRNFGQRNDTIIKKVAGDSLPWAEMEAIAAKKEEVYRRKVAHNIKPLPGVIELMKSLEERGMKMAIASSAPLENVQLIIRGLGITDYFQAVVWGREVTEGKPSPKVFLLAAERLQVASANCLVIEDAVAGVTAAKRAGMKCLAVTNTHPGTKLLEADLVVDSLETVNVNKLADLFG
jgi:beta-phosphoglucomutase family hydrolase